MQRVYTISETPTGGSRKYLQDLRAYYEPRGAAFHRLPTKAETVATLREHVPRKGDVLMFQYLLNTDFSWNDLLELVHAYDWDLVVPIHDKYFLNECGESDVVYHDTVHYCESSVIPAPKLQLLQRARYIVFPSTFIRDVFRKYLDLPSMVVVPPMDEWHVLPQTAVVPPLHDAFRIGVVTPPTVYKGIRLLETLYKECPAFDGKPVHFFVYADYDAASMSNVVRRGPYCEFDIYAKLGSDGVHALLFLNEYPETYSYALTKGLNAGIPILYSDMGAVGERIAEWRRTRIPCCSAEAAEAEEPYFATNNADLVPTFHCLLQHIATHARRQRPTVLIGKPKTVVPVFYDHLFLSTGVNEAASAANQSSVSQQAPLHTPPPPNATDPFANAP